MSIEENRKNIIENLSNIEEYEEPIKQITREKDSGKIYPVDRIWIKQKLL